MKLTEYIQLLTAITGLIAVLTPLFERLFG